jgi:hypothetical protein
MANVNLCATASIIEGLVYTFQTMRGSGADFLLRQQEASLRQFAGKSDIGVFQQAQEIADKAKTTASKRCMTGVAIK